MEEKKIVSQKENILNLLEKGEILIKKDYCRDFSCNERAFREIISQLAQEGKPIISLSNERGYYIPQVESVEKNIATIGVLEHQIREYESRIKILRKREKALKKLQSELEKSVRGL